MTGGPDEQQDAVRAALLLRVWSEPGTPAVLRARLVDAEGDDAGGTISTAVGTAEIGQEVLRWLGRITTGPAPAPPAAAAAPVAPLVGTGWLAEHRDDPDVVVLQVGDGPYLPGAARLDWDADLHEPDGRGVLGPAGFGRLLDRLGIGADSHVVLVGGRRPLLAASAYWVFAYHAHPRLSLLDGGLPRWVAEGREQAAAAHVRPAGRGYRVAASRRAILATRDQLLGGLVGAPPGTALVDCRSPEEFAGEPARPYDRPTDRHRMAGHIPGAVSLPAEDLLAEDGRLLDAVHIGRICGRLGLRASDQIVVYCGVNDRGALVWFALAEILGFTDVRCYYGGWAEYGSLSDTVAAQTRRPRSG
jgi:thiosulfate/3-mercaptopyruvate sulfurtransferase